MIYKRRVVLSIPQAGSVAGPDRFVKTIELTEVEILVTSNVRYRARGLDDWSLPDI